MQLANEPGSIIWNEQLSTDWAASKAFYGSVLGVEFNDMSSDEYSYSTIRVDGRDVGGIGAAEQGQGSWSVYFAVDDADEIVDQVVKLGGNVIKPVHDSNFGRMATVSDPEGAEFSVLSTPAEGYDDASG
jgi:predicted enzyme related to lactoylglutathione lyase